MATLKPYEVAEDAAPREELGQRLRERSLGLDEALVQLREAERQLLVQEKLASLGTLVSGMAHEIKNPLGFITSFAELSVELTLELAEQVAALEDRIGPDAVAELQQTAKDLAKNVAKISEHGRRADTIVRSMLEHARSRVGEAREVHLGTLVREYAAAALGVQPGQEPIAVTWELDPDLRAVRLVPEEIGRVILNLVSNAMYAMESKRRTAGPGYAPALLVATRDRGDQVEIRVRDNGTGIPAAIRDRVWSPFFTTKPTGAGTGLGLSICHDIVVQGHGGTMTVESEDGEFTEFCLRLPKQRASVRPAAPPAPLPSPSDGTPA